MVPKPPNVSFEEASGLMLTGGTAVHALTATGVIEGDILLLHGASGGVGLMVVQLAVAAGTDEALDVSVALVADRGRIATVANARRGLELGVKALGMAPGADPGLDIRDAARLQLARQAAEGVVTVDVAASYPLADAAAAHRELATGHSRGKIVLVP